MMLDTQLVLSDAQPLISLGDTPSTNHHVTIGPGDIGKGASLWLTILVAETFASNGAATLVATLETADASDFAGAVVLTYTVAIPVASLVAGYKILQARLPPPGVKANLRLRYTVGTAAMTAGKITAFLTLTADDSKQFPRAVYALA